MYLPLAEVARSVSETCFQVFVLECSDYDNIEIMRNVFFDPTKLRPDATSEAITQEVAQRVAQIAQGLRARGLDAMEVARFLERMV